MISALGSGDSERGVAHTLRRHGYLRLFNLVQMAGMCRFGYWAPVTSADSQGTLAIVRRNDSPEMRPAPRVGLWNLRRGWSLF